MHFLQIELKNSFTFRKTLWNISLVEIYLNAVYETIGSLGNLDFVKNAHEEDWANYIIDKIWKSIFHNFF